MLGSAGIMDLVVRFDMLFVWHADGVLYVCAVIWMLSGTEDNLGLM